MLYVFDRKERLIRIVPREEVKSALFTEELNQPEFLDCELRSNINIQDAVYIGHADPINAREFHLYKISSQELEGGSLYIRAVQSAYDDLLADGYLKDVRLYDVPVTRSLEALLEGSRWQVGVIKTQKNVHTNFYYCSRLEGLKKLLDHGLEVQFRLVVSGSKIISRYVDIYDKIGSDHGVRYAHGDKLLHVLKEENFEGVITRLVGRGKGEQLLDENGNLTDHYGRRITFADVVWKKSQGKPVDKPAGQEYVDIPEMTALFAYPDDKPRTRVIEFTEIDDPEKLLEASYEHLVEISRPRVSYSASVMDEGKTGLGDTVRIIRDDLGIRYMTRIYKKSLDLLLPHKVTIELGDQVRDYAIRRMTALEKKLDDVSNTTNDYVEQVINRIANLYWGEDGYNYDLEAGNIYGLPAGLYSYDRPIDQNPTKFIYFGAGKLVISNAKNPDGTWKIKTVMDGDGLGTGIVGAKQIIAGAINAGHIQSNSITSSHVKAGAITAAEIATGTITARQIASRTITASEIASDAINARHIAAGAITASKITTGRLSSRNGSSYFDLDTGYIKADSGYFSGTITASNISQSSITAGSYYNTGYSISSTGQVFTGHQQAYSFKYISGAISQGVRIGSSISVSETGIRMSVGSKIAVFERTGTAWLGIYNGNPDYAGNILWCVDNNGQVFTGSDRRLKKNIVKADRTEALDLIRELKLYEFDYRSSGDHRVGVIADFLKYSKNRYAPLIYGKAAGNYLGVDYTLLSTIALGAIQSIDERLQKVEEAIDGKSVQ